MFSLIGAIAKIFSFSERWTDENIFIISIALINIHYSDNIYCYIYSYMQTGPDCKITY